MRSCKHNKKLKPKNEYTSVISLLLFIRCRERASISLYVYVYIGCIWAVLASSASLRAAWTLSALAQKESQTKRRYITTKDESQNKKKHNRKNKKIVKKHRKHKNRQKAEISKPKTIASHFAHVDFLLVTPHWVVLASSASAAWTTWCGFERLERFNGEVPNNLDARYGLPAVGCHVRLAYLYWSSRPLPSFHVLLWATSVHTTRKHSAESSGAEVWEIIIYINICLVKLIS